MDPALTFIISISVYELLIGIDRKASSLVLFIIVDVATAILRRYAGAVRYWEPLP